MPYLYAAPFRDRPACNFGWYEDNCPPVLSEYILHQVVAVRMPTSAACKAVFNALFDKYHPFMISGDLPNHYLPEVVAHMQAQGVAFAVIGDVYPDAPRPKTRFDLIDEL